MVLTIQSVPYTRTDLALGAMALAAVSACTCGVTGAEVGPGR